MTTHNPKSTRGPKVTRGPKSPGVTPADRAAGIIAMCAAMTCFIVSDVFSKLAMATLPIGETIALRGVISVAIFAVPVLLARTVGLMRTQMSWLWLLRIVTEIGGAVSFVSAIAYLPIANVVAIAQTSPLIMTAIAAIFLGEVVGRRRWLATVVGFCGVLLIVKPGASGFSWWSILPICSMVCILARDIATRRMDRTIPATLITFSTAIGVTFSGFGMGVFETNWHWPSAGEWAYLTAAALFVAMAYYFSIDAVRKAELSTVAPFRYVIVPLSLLAGWLVWSEVPDQIALAGIAIIAGAGVYTFLRERSLHRTLLP
jgi:drug/metabolite transporter (DMT)-like permease